MWRRRMRTALLSVSPLVVLYVGHAETVIGLVGAVVGFAASRWNQGDHGQHHPPRSSGT